MTKLNIGAGWTCQQWKPGAQPFAVDLPHDFSIHQARSPECESNSAGGYYPGGNLIYEKQLEFSPDMCLGRAVLRFDGVYMNAQVFFDGIPVAREPYGYMTFYADITGMLTPGTHTLRVNAAGGAMPNSRWYAGSGIFRNVYLLLSGTSGFAPDGIFAEGSINASGTGRLELSADIRGTARAEGRSICAELADPEGNIAAVAEFCAEDSNAQTVIELESPRPWSCESPALYTLTLSLRLGDSVLDTGTLRVGFRNISLDRENGLLLNGKPVKLYGGCVHHDCGILGSACYPEAEKRKVRLMLENGFNAVRCAHNPPSVEFLDACDELGMLVLDEFTDMWNVGKNPADYHLYFGEWHERDMQAWLRRDRNHPCVIIWSTGNEIPERSGMANGYRLQRELVNIVRELGGKRLITCALNNISRSKAEMLAANLQQSNDDYFADKSEEFLAPLDVAGYNYLGRRYEKDLARYPERFILGTESVALECAEYIDMLRRLPRVIGDFLWTSIDYIGEAGLGNVRREGDNEQGYTQSFPWRYANCGDIDIIGDKRPQSYYRDAVLGRLSEPYIAVQHPAHSGDDGTVSYWGWPERVSAWEFPGYEGAVIRVDVYIAGKRVCLRLNGETLAESSAVNYTASFNIKYAPGTLEAIDSDTGAVSALVTPGAPAAIALETEAASTAPGSLIYVTARLTDAEGKPVRLNTRRVSFSCEGGTILACGSADPACNEPLDGTGATTWNGRCLCVIKATCGSVSVTARAPGCREATAVFN